MDSTNDRTFLWRVFFNRHSLLTIACAFVLASRSGGSQLPAVNSPADVAALCIRLEEARRGLFSIWNSGMDRKSTEYQTAIRKQHEKVIWIADQILSATPDDAGHWQADAELAGALRRADIPHFIARPPANLRELAYQAKLDSLQQLGFLPEEAGARARAQIKEFTAWMVSQTDDPTLQTEYRFDGLRARATSSLPEQETARALEVGLLVTEMKAWLEENRAQKKQALLLIADGARLGERSGLPDAAVFFYEQLASASGDAERVRFAEGAIRRLKLPGRRLELSGPLLSGDVFDLRDLRGKVVLIDFWYTACRPCVEEIENTFLPLYEKYQQHGFEIVGIPNDSRERLEQFIRQRNIRWPQIYIESKPADPLARVAPDAHPIAERYGIYAWPTLFLVDQNGVVVSTTLRGDQVEPALRKLLAANS
jgi:peroxiredoxin